MKAKIIKISKRTLPADESFAISLPDHLLLYQFRQALVVVGSVAAEFAKISSVVLRGRAWV